MPEQGGIDPGPGGMAGPRDSGRVLMIAPTSFFADYGCHVRILEEARILRKLGYGVVITTYANGRDLPDVDIRRTISIPWRAGWEIGSSRHKIAFDILLALRCMGVLWQLRPTVIHAHLHEGALIGLVLSRLWRVPLVFDFQGSMTSEMVDHHFLSPKGSLFQPLRHLETAIDRAVPHIITSSVHAANLLTHDFGCNPARITCVPDGVNADHFSPASSPEDVVRLKRAWGIPSERKVVVYLGKLAEYQGTDHLLQAASAICSRRQDVHFVIAGYPFEDHYENLARRMGLGEYTTFTGRVRYEDAPRLLTLGDVAVFPKLSKSEGAGKLLNYMAMALPTVAFDTPVSREYLGDDGVYAKSGDSDDLALSLETLLDAPQRRVEIGTSLRRKAREGYDWERIGRQVVAVYTALPGRRTRAAEGAP